MKRTRGPISRSLATFVATAALCAGGGLTASTATAGSYTYCGYWINHGQRCPNISGSSHPRHTYYNNESRWTYTRYGGCNKYISSTMHIAYENSIGQIKYNAHGCNWFIDSFPNNTQLLRPYVGHSQGGESLQMVGDADW